jgi:hypothetical protein
MTGATDFDFLIGDWTVQHRRLRERLTGCGEWDVFQGTTSVRKILGGIGNVDDNVIDLPGGSYRAMSLRAFDAQTGRWSIWWLDGRFPGRVDTPVLGGFHDGIGTFYAEDILDGRPIRIRFRWTEIGTASPVWEQAFSPDGGASWENNWMMRFSRAA